MPHHYPKSTVYVQVFCPTCNKQTVHHVWDGRLGRCVEDHSKVKPQENMPFVPKEPEQQELFKK